MRRSLFPAFVLWACGAVTAAAPADPPGTWTSGAFYTGLSLLLTDGSVLQQTAFSSSTWQRIVTDASGHYDWSHPVAVAAMHDTRGFFASVVTRDGRVFVAGGEYGTGHHTAEIYDPVTNVWTPVPNTFSAAFYDCTAVNLPDGRVLTLPNGITHGYIYDPVSNAWSQTPENAFTFNETGVVELPGGRFLAVSQNSYPATAIYLPATGQWIAGAPAPTGADAFDTGGEGTKVLLYDGRVLAVGQTGKCAFYTPGTAPTDPGSWTPGPALPDNSKIQDATSAVMANGHVLIFADQGGHTGPTRIYDFNPLTNAFVEVTPAGGISSWSDPYMALLLPTGEVAVAGLGVYVPVGGPQDAWRPEVTSIDPLGGGTYRLTGRRLTGLTEGAYYGDDAQMSTNYPLFRLTGPGGAVTFARTFNFSTMAVSTGTASVTADFKLPALPDGSYTVEVLANAVPSAASTLRIQGGQVIGSTIAGSVGGSGSPAGGGGGGGGCGATGLEAVFALAFLPIWRQIRRRRPVY
jgi:hypothetical protein